MQTVLTFVNKAYMKKTQQCTEDLKQNVLLQHNFLIKNKKTTKWGCNQGEFQSESFIS